MPYIVSASDITPTVDLEFDHLSADLEKGLGERVRQRCKERLSSPEGCLWSHLLLGYLELRDGRFRLAHHHFTQAVPLSEPLGSEARAGLGRALVGLSRHSEALELLRAVVEEQPGCFFGWYALAELLKSVKEGEGAWECARVAITLCPTDAAALSLLISLGHDLNQHQELADILSAALAEQPWNLDVRAARVVALSRLNRRSEALEELYRIRAFVPFFGISQPLVAAIQDNLGEKTA